MCILKNIPCVKYCESKNKKLKCSAIAKIYNKKDIISTKQEKR
jgi:hypothetical protein